MSVAAFTLPAKRAASKLLYSLELHKAGRGSTIVYVCSATYTGRHGGLDRQPTEAVHRAISLPCVNSLILDIIWFSASVLLLLLLLDHRLWTTFERLKVARCQGTTFRRSLSSSVPGNFPNETPALLQQLTVQPRWRG